MKLTQYALIFSLLSCVLACSSMQTFNISTPEGAFKQAEEYVKFHRYEEAISRFREVKRKFPYSEYAKTSDLRVADINFEREAFIEAQASYQLFKDFYPKDQKVDYVTFQIGLSCFKQLPEAPGRDLSVAGDCLRAFDEVMALYPNSEFASKARDHKQKTLKLLAKKQLYIADFYFKQKNYLSALGRYEDLLSQYSNLGFNKRALFGAVKSAKRAQQNEKAKQYSNELNRLFSDSSEARQAQKEVGL